MKEKFETLTKSSILQRQKELEKQARRLEIPCSHTTKKGKLKTQFVNGTLAECKECGVKFDFGVIELNELDKAVRVLHNAINQIKAFSEDPEADRKTIIQLGDLDYNLREIRELYRKACDKYSKGGKKKHKNEYRDDFGSYGLNSLNFSSKKKKKHQY